MPPTTIVVSKFSEVKAKEYDEWSLKSLWYGFADWVVRVAHGINDETLEHPYFISFALLVLWAWPHLLMLPVWFGKDAYRRMDDHARSAVDRISTARQRKRNTFMSRYRSVVNASYEPIDSSRPPLFGGTPLHEGNFDIEEEHHLPIMLRVIRWSALAWAVFIIGRELYFFMVRY